jgi:Sulfotransferase family
MPSGQISGCYQYQQRTFIRFYESILRIDAIDRRESQVPVFKNHWAFEVARGIRVFLNVEAGVARDGASEAGSKTNAPKVSGEVGRIGVQRVEEVEQRIVQQDQDLGRSARRSPTSAGVKPENIVWIFGAGRTGSSWLSQMMGELKGHTVWFEPWVGALFDPYHLRLEDRKGKHFILAPQYKKTWLRSIRTFVLDGVDARFPEAAGASNYLVIKEPGGSVGASLLMEALPESKMILLVRDPRDVVASWIDAHREGGWKDGRRKERNRPLVPVDRRARKYLQNVGEAKKAYDSHEGRKALVKYEELRADTLGAMRRIYSELGIEVNEEELARAVEKHSWENIPEKDKGEGKFYRKATPGSWSEDLTPEQVKTVENITAPLLEEFYPNNTP